MVKYDINVDVKYKRIETELLENFSNKKENDIKKEDENYDKTDIQFVCEELYRFELLSAFKAESILDDQIDEGFNELWQLINNYTNFTNIVNKFSKKLGLEKEQKLGFTLMFNFDLYYIVHQCLQEYVNNGYINKNLLDELDKGIDKMVF